MLNSAESGDGVPAADARAEPGELIGSVFSELMISPAGPWLNQQTKVKGEES